LKALLSQQKPMKIISALFMLLVCSLNSIAQKSDSTYTHYAFYRGLSSHVTELKSKRGIKNGEYKIFGGRKIIATGLYKDNERIGRWRFFNENDSLDQVYNYTTQLVEYNLPNQRITCYIDSIKEGDKIIPPMKVGGAFGLLFLTRLFLPPMEVYRGSGAYNLLHLFTLDEHGKLIRYETKIDASNYKKVEEIPLKKLKTEDFEFTPAKVNGKNVSSTLVFEVLVKHPTKN
jgi:hypothetical protein